MISVSLLPPFFSPPVSSFVFGSFGETFSRNFRTTGVPASVIDVRDGVPRYCARKFMKRTPVLRVRFLMSGGPVYSARRTRVTVRRNFSALFGERFDTYWISVFDWSEHLSAAQIYNVYSRRIRGIIPSKQPTEWPLPLKHLNIREPEHFHFPEMWKCTKDSREIVLSRCSLFSGNPHSTRNDAVTFS